MKHTINIRGVMIPNDYKFYYDYFGNDSTCPKDVQRIIDAYQDGDEIEVFINSPGGVITTGSEIYTLLKKYAEHTKMYITGEACSAASIVAMAAYCEMAPTALMMVHCVSSKIAGNHSDMTHMAEVLETADRALCTAYTSKSGMTEEDALAMMNHETWLTAKQAKERGLVDGIMFEDQEEEQSPLVAGPMFALPSQDQMEKVKGMLKGCSCSPLLQTKLNFLKKKGELQ